MHLRMSAELAAWAQVADRRDLQKELAQLDAEREMLQVQQEECASQMQKVSNLPAHLPRCGGQLAAL